MLIEQVGTMQRSFFLLIWLDVAPDQCSLHGKGHAAEVQRFYDETTVRKSGLVSNEGPAHYCHRH